VSYFASQRTFEAGIVIDRSVFVCLPAILEDYGYAEQTDDTDGPGAEEHLPFEGATYAELETKYSTLEEKEDLDKFRPKSYQSSDKDREMSPLGFMMATAAGWKLLSLTVVEWMGEIRADFDRRGLHEQGPAIAALDLEIREEWGKAWSRTYPLAGKSPLAPDAGVKKYTAAAARRKLEDKLLQEKQALAHANFTPLADGSAVDDMEIWRARVFESLHAISLFYQGNNLPPPTTVMFILGQEDSVLRVANAMRVDLMTGFPAPKIQDVDTVPGPWEALWGGGSLYSPVPGTSLVSHLYIEQNFSADNGNFPLAASGNVFDLYLVREEKEGRTEWRWQFGEPEEPDEEEEAPPDEETPEARHERFRSLQTTIGAQFEVRPLAVSPV